jgi:hypothetical protein
MKRVEKLLPSPPRFTVHALFCGIEQGRARGAQGEMKAPNEGC